MKKSLIILLLGIATVLKVNAQEPQEIIDQFFKNYKEKDCKTAVQVASKTNPWLESETEKMNRWENRLTQLSNQNGDYCGYEILETNKIGTSFISYVCFVKHIKEPFRITLTFYKPKDKWQLNNILIGQNNRTSNTRFKK